MALLGLRKIVVIIVPKVAIHCLAQDNPDLIVGAYHEPTSGINFTTWTAPLVADVQGSYTFGMVLPEDALTKASKEYIGLLRCKSTSANKTGWCGLAHAGHMLQDLLLMAWPYNGQVLTSFRYADNYFMPGLYTGNATITQISSWVNSTSYEVAYRCEDCFSWAQNEHAESSLTTDGSLVFGYAQALNGPTNPGCPQNISYLFHDNGYGQWQANLGGTNSSSYQKWTDLATKKVPGEATCHM